MRLCSVDLVNFRNYETLSLSFPGGTHILYGANAQGKTNLLEAIYLCTCGRSHRTGRDEDLVRHGQEFYRTQVAFVTDRGIGESVSIEYKKARGREGTPSRTIRYNGLAVNRLADMMGLFHAILFAPEDLQIVKGGPAERRRFLDILISRTDRSYFRDLQDYLRVMAQRNRLLKSMRQGEGGGDDQLDIWDEALAGQGARLLEKRLAHVDKLASYASLSLQHLTSSREELALSYRGFRGLRTGQSREELQALFLDRLLRSRQDDLFRGSSSQGPHRDDLAISLNGEEARLFASQGQQRSLVLALKIAELMVLTELTGEKPILLLDDVMSELDASRRDRLMEVIQDHQVFLSCTDPDQTGLVNQAACPGAWSGPVHYYQVKEGRVLEGKRPVL